MFRFAVMSALIGVAVANPIFRNVISDEISATSDLGTAILSKARLLNEDNNEGDNNNNNTNDFSATWVANYSIKFAECHTIADFERNGLGARNQLLAKFYLCPSNSCGRRCKKGGEYIVDMTDFVGGYLQSKMNLKQYACESGKETCQYYCNKKQGNYYDEDTCMTACYSNAGLSYCEEDYANEFSAYGYIECQKMAYVNNVQYYIGAHCAKKGSEVRLGLFTDQYCTKNAPSGIYEKLNGMALPYSTQSIVSNDCVSCKEPQNNNNKNQGDYYDKDQVLEVCQNLYTEAAKCESSMGISNPDNESCDFIQSTVPRMERALAGKTGGKAALAFAWIFFITSGLLGVYVFYLFTRAKRLGVDLSSQGGGVSA